MPNIIQSFWHGDRLSNIENLCIKSFLKNGYEYHLYTYKEIDNIPDDTIVKNANEIIDSKDFIKNILYESKNDSWAYGSFSDLFRFRLLYENGGWWHDTDSCCVQPFNFTDEYIFGRQYIIHNYTLKKFVCGGVIKTPKKNEFFKKCFDISYNTHKQKHGQIEWASIGPKLISDQIEKFHIKPKIFDPVTFYPIKYWETKKQFLSPPKLPINNNIYCIHFYTSTWSKEDANKIYDSNSLIGYLYEKYN